MLLQGKRIVVTGGVTAIGKATVLACVREGATVVSMSQADAAATRVVKIIDAARELGRGPIRCQGVDLSSKGSIDGAFKQAVAWLGGLDVLIHCAMAQGAKPATELPARDFYGQQDIVLGTAFANAAAFRHMREAGGSIVNNTFEAGIDGQWLNAAASSAARGGVIGYSRAIAHDCRRHLIRVNVVVPAAGIELDQDYVSEEWEQTPAYLASITPSIGRMPTPDAVADVDVFLASDLSRGVSGQFITVGDGVSTTYQSAVYGSHTNESYPK